ncbi:thioredoxin domain-containing protein [Sulfurimonas sp.]|uniref:thioredoxin domain-containing protein n=1 Tax=Sulfurimonas sp. TaxID=2022749 RepID=UPI002B473CCC|nr:DUF255 domain-containing protein [Sulfurimonas sp.]
MKRIIISLIFVISLNAQNGVNSLSEETSPYLIQHATNPINWVAYSDEVFAIAKRENKKVFLSIGYSTCHWCHVMAKESFENKKISKIFNKNFICVKIDKEEMPHLDIYYQELHKKVKNRVGGWPLSVFLNDKKELLFIGTYIPLAKKVYHEGLDTLLEKIANGYKIEYKEELIKIKRLKTSKAKITIESLSLSILKEYDDVYSGFGRGKKFPEASKLSLMMDLALLTKNKKLQTNALNMLDAMAMRGLYDHIDGGFFRYSVDAAWEIPHFEKMLYNQAELIPLYVRAYLLTNKHLYKDVVEETIKMVKKRFSKNNLFYSASDADTNHKEGEYFVFTTSQIQKAKKQSGFEFEEFTNFNDYIHLSFEDDKRNKGFKKFRSELKKVRAKKIYPFIDKKINTAWNAMMIEALFKASIIDNKYAKKGTEHLEALLEFMHKRGELYHQSIMGVKPKQLGLLEDYSFLISALIAGYEVDYDEHKLVKAEYFLAQAKHRFYKDGIWYLSNDKLDIKADMNDKYYTSALAKMTQNIIRLASLKSSFRYEKLALETLEYQNDKIEKELSKVPASAIAFLMQKQKVVTLKNSKEILLQDKRKIKKISYPYILSKKDKTKGNYLACTMRSCFASTPNFYEIKDKIQAYNIKVYK